MDISIEIQPAYNGYIVTFYSPTTTERYVYSRWSEVIDFLDKNKIEEPKTPTTEY